MANGVLLHRLGDVHESCDGLGESRSREESQRDFVDGIGKLECSQVGDDSPGRRHDDRREEGVEKPDVGEPTAVHVASQNKSQADETR